VCAACLKYSVLIYVEKNTYKMQDLGGSGTPILYIGCTVLKGGHCTVRISFSLFQITPGFELYVAFEPLVTKQSAINAVDKLLGWIKKEEDRLFILNAPTF
jgi:hypothetical protein